MKHSENLLNQTVKISPRGYKMANGIDYCSIGLKSRDGSHYSIEAYGDEVIKLDAN